MLPVLAAILFVAVPLLGVFALAVDSRRGRVTGGAVLLLIVGIGFAGFGVSVLLGVPAGWRLAAGPPELRSAWSGATSAMRFDLDLLEAPWRVLAAERYATPRHDD